MKELKDMLAVYEYPLYSKEDSQEEEGEEQVKKRGRYVIWQDFCEKNGLGDIYHDVKFEDMKQSDQKKAFLLKFAQNPGGIVIMRGNPGTGKTFSSIAVCEMYTREKNYCMFVSQRKIFNKWLDYTRGEGSNNWLHHLECCELLVIDDFGTSEPSPGFMGFFMDLINSRMQWKQRGTIISTNLTDEKMNQFCGDALNDRLSTGQVLLFTGKSRRKPVIS